VLLRSSAARSGRASSALRSSQHQLDRLGRVRTSAPWSAKLNIDMSASSSGEYAAAEFGRWTLFIFALICWLWIGTG